VATKKNHVETMRMKGTRIPPKPDRSCCGKFESRVKVGKGLTVVVGRSVVGFAEGI